MEYKRLTRREVEAANKWVECRNQTESHIKRLQDDLALHLSKCQHWTFGSYTSREEGNGYYRCEWCGKEWE